ncbi:MAG: hypothetical protein XD50_1384 [Clostridia bacterium 41_269]|nr:MAG: hypothetical protein XD50_1384 [Clostridia bacterium 41_269]
MKYKPKVLKEIKISRDLSKKNKFNRASKYYILSENSGFPTADYFFSPPNTLIIMQQDDNTSSWHDY